MNFYVYVIQEVKVSKTAPIKIGVSNDVERRLGALQVSNPRELAVKLRFGPMSRADAYNLERHLLTKLKHCRLRGEWFSGKALNLIFESGRTRAA